MVTLPLELIHEIIEASVDGSLSQVAALATISRDFYRTVQPILGRTLWYYHESPDRQWPVPAQDLPRWIETNGRYVHNLMWGIELDRLPYVFNNCPNITNLAVWVNVPVHDRTSLLPSLSTLHLNRLSIDLSKLFGQTAFTEIQAQNSAFQSITQLSIFHNIEQWQDIEGVASLPRLTHLRLPDDVLEDDDLCRDVIHHALQECKRLKVLIIILGGSVLNNEGFKVLDVKDVPGLNLAGLHDPRLVPMKVANILQDWKRGAKQGKDFWAFADGVVERRRSGLGGQAT